MTGNSLYDAIVAASLFGNSAIGLIVMVRQSRNANRQVAMHVQNQAAIATLAEDMTVQHAEISKRLTQ